MYVSSLLVPQDTPTVPKPGEPYSLFCITKGRILHSPTRRKMNFLLTLLKSSLLLPRLLRHDVSVPRVIFTKPVWLFGFPTKKRLYRHSTPGWGKGPEEP